MTNNDTHRRRGGLGGLLAATAEPEPPAPVAAPPADDTPSPQTAGRPAARATGRPAGVPWIVLDDTTRAEIGRVHAPTQRDAIAAAQQQLGRHAGFTLLPVNPATGQTLPVPRPLAPQPTSPYSNTYARPAQQKLTCSISRTVHLGVEELMRRDGMQRRIVVEEALIAYLADRGITLEEEF